MFLPRICFVVAIAVLLSACRQGDRLSEKYPVVDIAISDALIYNGLGQAPYTGNILIVGEEIVYIGIEEVDDLDIRTLIDGSGYVVTPGFIDLHAHGDPYKTPGFDNFLHMGVTTIVLGQDGSSPIDLRSWTDTLPATGTNLAYFLGHGSLRKEVAGLSEKPLSDSQLNTMLGMIQSQASVIHGVSMGIEYIPGTYADQNELIAVAKTAGKHNKLIMSHIRNEDDDQLEASLGELIQLGEYCNVHVAHLKSVYGKGIARASDILDIIRNAREGGINISADVYPYFASYTGIGIVFPLWAKRQSDFDLAKQNRRTELASFLRNKVHQRNGPEATILGTHPYTGKTLQDLENEFNKPFEDILIDDIGPTGASGAYFIMDADLQKKLLTDPMTGISSDGSPTMNHPRGYGSFSRMIEEFVVRDSLISLPEMIRQMTSYPAEILKLRDRGVVKEGFKADLLLFKPGEIETRATYDSPHQLSKGFHFVIVNGKITIDDGKRVVENGGYLLLPSDQANASLQN